MSASTDKNVGPPLRYFHVTLCRQRRYEYSRETEVIQHQYNTEKTDAPEVPGASSYQKLRNRLLQQLNLTNPGVVFCLHPHQVDPGHEVFPVPHRLITPSLIFAIN